MEVFAVVYGCIDYENEVTQSLYTTEELALAAANEAVDSIFDDSPDLVEEGWTVNQTTTDDGRPVLISITPDGTEAEWWRIEPMKVHGDEQPFFYIIEGSEVIKINGTKEDLEEQMREHDFLGYKNLTNFLEGNDMYTRGDNFRVIQEELSVDQIVRRWV